MPTQSVASANSLRQYGKPQGGTCKDWRTNLRQRAGSHSLCPWVFGVVHSDATGHRANLGWNCHEKLGGYGKTQVEPLPPNCPVRRCCGSCITLHALGVASPPPAITQLPAHHAGGADKMDVPNCRKRNRGTKHTHTHVTSWTWAYEQARGPYVSGAGNATDASTRARGEVRKLLPPTASVGSMPEHAGLGQDGTKP